MSLQRFFILFLVFTTGWSSVSFGQSAARSRWVDSVYQSLTLEERIGQMFMVAAYSGGKNYNEAEINRLILNKQIGGLIFMQGGPARQALLTNKYQAAANVPLLIGMDAEWGLGMRLDSVANFPRQMMLGATDDSLLMYQVGAAIAAQCNRLGVHINFAPVVDVNNNAANPVINVRSFGEDKTRVARMGIAYMHGLQKHGVLACAKHFPGHGDTDVDSHKDLPIIKKSVAQLDSLELYPFRELIRAGVKSMMVAHLEVPALEQEKNVPTTLSKITITGLLKQKMGYQGLIFTDAMNMKGVTKYYDPGEADLRAFLAGNDVLLFSQDVPVAIQKIKEALAQNKVNEQDLEHRVKKILGAKYDVGLHQWKPIRINGIVADLNKEIVPMRQRVAEAAVTWIRDENDIVNKLNSPGNRIGYVAVNASSSAMYNQLKTQATVAFRALPKGSTDATSRSIINEINTNNATIIAVHNLNIYPGKSGNYGLDIMQLNFLKQVYKRKDIMIVVMGNPYLLKDFCEVGSAIVGYEDDTLTQKVVAEILQGTREATGRLPVTPCKSILPRSTGMKIPGAKIIETLDSINLPPDRLYKVFHVEDAGVTNPMALDKLNLFIERCVVAQAFPGCRIIAAKDGKVFYNESFGTYSYDSDQKVTAATMYDLASLTKILSTTLAVMKLYEEGKLQLNKQLGDYLPMVQNSPHARATIKNLLLHQAGLKAWIPFYKQTIEASGQLNPALYRQRPEPGFNQQVAANLYLRNDYVDSIWQRINQEPAENRGKGVYSDLDFFYLAAVVEKISGQRIDQYVHEHFYKPLGLTKILYNPLRSVDAALIAPTENDMVFRNQILRGYVHDQAAAMMGGVAGHAGLFATANDVAVLMQMLVNKGLYKGVRYFKEETVEYFTAYHSAISRRGLGFDKPEADAKNAAVTSNRCSGYTFGHLGFTGTCTWADPEHGIIFVLLSNRVHPSADNKKITTLKVRTQAMDYIYEALGIPVNTNRPAVKSKQLAQFK